MRLSHTATRHYNISPVRYANIFSDAVNHKVSIKIFCDKPCIWRHLATLSRSSRGGGGGAVSLWRVENYPLFRIIKYQLSQNVVQENIIHT